VKLTRQRILVTGAGGFFGQHVVHALLEHGCTTLFTPSRLDCDLCEREEVDAFFAAERPEIVIHLAAVVGGIGANLVQPGRFLYENALMGLHVLEACRQHEVSKLVIAGTVCAYPKFCPVPFREDDLWNGYPEETNAAYGIAKKMLLGAAQAYRVQYGTPAIMLVPVNLYGPGDHFDLETGHVIPSLIRKFVEAHERDLPSVTIWGDGTPTREFLYAADAAKAFVIAAETYDDPAPINLGTGKEISILELASMIAATVGYNGQIVFDPSKPNGQPRRSLDTSRAKERLGWQATTRLHKGVEDTLAWYLQHR